MIRVAFQNRNQNKNISKVITIHTANKPLFVSKLYSQTFFSLNPFLYKHTLLHMNF